MSTMPTNLSPETTAWLQAQMVINNAKTAAILRAEITKVDDWANGIFAALRDVLSHQLRKSPELASDLAAQWSCTAAEFDQIHLHGQAPRDNESLEYLEARKMLFRLFSVVGSMPQVEKKS